MKHKKLHFFFLLTFMFCSIFVQGQEEKTPNKTSNTLIDFNIGYCWSAGDLSDRFGAKNVAGLGVSKMTSSNWIYGLKGNFFFGRNVNEDVLSGLRNEQGNVLGIDGMAAIVRLRERGVNFNAYIGKVFSFTENSKSGLKITLGVGMLQHWVRMQDETRTIPQIGGEYVYGYDKKTRGFSLNQFVGYQNLSSNKRLNYYAGVEMYQGFTKNIRPFNFNTQSAENEARKDINVGIKVGLIIPFYHADNPEEIFY